VHLGVWGIDVQQKIEENGYPGFAQQNGDRPGEYKGGKGGATGRNEQRERDDSDSTREPDMHKKESDVCTK
jgi:hypothetical protein